MQHVEVKVHENVATILMDRSNQRNALNPRMIEDLQTAFSDVHQEKRAKSVVLAGSGEHFCAGLDLQVMNEIATLPPADAATQWYSSWGQFTELIEQMLRFPKPIIAAVDGSALGAGLAIALAADIVVASKTAEFGSVAVRRGLVAGATTALIAFRFGSAIAARMSLTGQPIDANEAYRLGMCTEPVESNQIWVAATDWASRCSDAPREAVQATKKVLNETIGETLMTQITAGAATSAAACTTDSASEGIDAFCMKRPPQWP